MYEFHSNKPKYFNWQYETCKEFVIPFVKPHVDFSKKLRVLEIGCAEAGVLKAFIEEGHECVGIELSENRAELARQFQPEAIENGQLSIITKNIYDIDVETDLDFRFDIVILKDVIEHIHDQKRFIGQVHKFLNPGGVIFFGFPPWMMPFGGHQQVARSKILNKLPYFHLLPMPLYKGVLKGFGEPQVKVDNMAEIKETGISIERFERLVKESGFEIKGRKFWLLNPIYKHKFNAKPRGQAGLIGALPWVRNFFTTAVYYVIG